MMPGITIFKMETASAWLILHLCVFPL